jgi:Family of unknown function (DUF6186)
VTISRSLTIAGWVVIAVAIATAWIASLVSRGQFPSLVALFRLATRNVAVRVVALAGWAWLGWHFFVRTSR